MKKSLALYFVSVLLSIWFSFQTYSYIKIAFLLVALIHAGLIIKILTTKNRISLNPAIFNLIALIVLAIQTYIIPFAHPQEGGIGQISVFVFSFIQVIFFVIGLVVAFIVGIAALFKRTQTNL